MKGIAVFTVEILKLRRSKILLITMGIFIFIPLMMAMMMFVSKNPDIAAKLGLFGTKAKMFSENDWTGYGTLIIQSLASVGFIGYGFVTSWVFGREHIDRTFKDMLSLPVNRFAIPVHLKPLNISPELPRENKVQLLKVLQNLP